MHLDIPNFEFTNTEVDTKLIFEFYALKANIKGVLNRLVKTDAMVTSSLVTLLKVLKVVLICQQLSLASHLFCTKVAATDMRGKLRSGQIVFANQMA